MNTIKTALAFVKDHAVLFLIGLVVALLIGLSIAIKKISSLKETNDRYMANQEALTSELQNYKTKDGKNAVSVMQQTFTASEFKKLYADEYNKLKDNGISPKRVESYTKAGSETSLNAKVNLKDSIVYHFKDSVVYTTKLRKFEWSDSWNKIDGIVYNDSVECNYSGRDTLNIVAHRVPKKFLFFKFGTKYIKVDIINANPHSKIDYAKAVKFTKK